MKTINHETLVPRLWQAECYGEYKLNRNSICSDGPGGQLMEDGQARGRPFKGLCGRSRELDHGS